MGFADGTSGGRPVTPALLIKSGNQPLSHCRESLVTYSYHVAGLHVPLIKGIHFVHPNPCRSKVNKSISKLHLSPATATIECASPVVPASYFSFPQIQAHEGSKKVVKYWP